MGRLLFGLGNPGRAYAATRHNAGWLALDLVAERHGASFRASRFVDAEVAELDAAGRRVRLVKPLSFMNLVGPVYARALEVFECEPSEGLVVLDDFALPFGRLRARAEGSHGGHKGLLSIQGALGSAAYPRLRLGIGPVPPQIDPADYVLGRYDAEQKRLLPDLVGRAADACLVWVAEGIEAVMNRFNAGA